ncbi:hypothetical protein C7999DRAFT_17383 [Corynascus novoguineensis]|uniref:SET domain-containing protein n=1 Tax=Corynascus novoguineensis TaxID=1126955 RepID=A0AAN7HGC3_9PEZI|nr:hypothetical protein C7999DRAFT_17383 [Corynascus novoguineensis]
MASNTVYLTEQEVQRIRTTVKENAKKRSELRGNAREARGAKDAISQATGAALMADMGSMTMDKAKESIPALAVGQPYPPCTKSVKELQPMKLADLTMETHHRGRQLSVKRASPVVMLTSRSWTMAQDEAGETERLELLLHKTRHRKDILDSNSTFIIKEPYFTLTEEGEPTLRIDHPSDLVVLPNTQDAQPLAPDAAPEEVEKRATSHKQKGNAALTKGDLPLAHASYTAGLALAARLPTPDLARDLHRNRAHVNLLLSQFDAAEADALAALIPSPPAEPVSDANDDASLRTAELNAKCYFRAGTAAYNLGRFADARAHFERQLSLMPQDKGATANRTRGGEEEGAGGGALTAVTYDIRDDRIRVAPVGLERAIVERTAKNPSLIGEVMGLYGDWDGGEGKGIESTEDGPVVDVFRVHDIVARNAFGAGSKDGQGGGASAGLWIRAAYLNHSCVPNAEREFVGDLMIIRAIKDIAAGEEIVHSYDESGDYEARQQALMTTWGFECACALCAAEKGDDAAVREKRAKLVREGDEFLKSAGSSTNKRLAIVKAKRLLAAIDETYDEKKYRGLPRLATRRLQQWLTAASARR